MYIDFMEFSLQLYNNKGENTFPTIVNIWSFCSFLAYAQRSNVFDLADAKILSKRRLHFSCKISHEKTHFILLILKIERW